MAPGLLEILGWDETEAWRRHWLDHLQRLDGPLDIDPVLLWGFALPLLSSLWSRQLPESPYRPVIGLQAPVGAGKTTLARHLQRLAASRGLRLAVASIDDAYLPWSERLARMQGNPFGVTRVPPGSHDPPVLVEAIASWQQGGPLVLPRFDKTLRQGQGDRSGWSTSLDADALLLEGWLVGHEPVGPQRLQAWLMAAQDIQGCASGPMGDGPLSRDEQDWLPIWDQHLRAYTPLWDKLDSLWVIHPQCWSRVLRWRLQAEARQRRSGAPSLTSAEVKRLVRASQASLPPALYAPTTLGRARAVATLDGRRRCLAVVPPLE